MAGAKSPSGSPICLQPDEPCSCPDIPIFNLGAVEGQQIRDARGAGINNPAPGGAGPGWNS